MPPVLPAVSKGVTSPEQFCRLCAWGYLAPVLELGVPRGISTVDVDVESVPMPFRHVESVDNIILQ